MKERNPKNIQKLRIESLKDRELVMWRVPEFRLDIPIRSDQVRRMARILRKKGLRDVNLRVESGRVIMRVVDVRRQRIIRRSTKDEQKRG